MVFNLGFHLSLPELAVASGIGIKSHLEGAHERFVNGHHAASIIELAAVVRCRE